MRREERRGAKKRERKGGIWMAGMEESCSSVKTEGKEAIKQADLLSCFLDRQVAL